jgi:ectoine hydroxylase-related dioxygenase (phytanoyl-CoA dioxygenase family)
MHAENPPRYALHRECDCEGTDRVVFAWIPLGDTPVSRGPLIYLEGSHHRALEQEAKGTLKRPAASVTADLPAPAEEYDDRWLGDRLRRR